MITDVIEKSKQQLKSLVGSIEKQYGKGSIMTLGDQAMANVRVISSGSIALDQALGVGGFPKGRIVEIYGPESGGKTTLTLHAIREVQRTGGTAAFIDAEHAFDVAYARAIGVDTDKLLFIQPDCGEQALDIAEQLVRSGQIDIVVVDSVAALVPKAEIEGDMGDAHVGLHARLMSQALRKLTASVHRTETTLVFVNQLRHKIGVMFGSPETTTGGNALKFYASVRLDVRRIGTVKSGEEAVGSRTRVKVVKNKMAPPLREAEFDLRWGKGIDEATDLLDYGCFLGVVDKSGSHLSFAGEHLGQGRERSREALLADPRLMSAVRLAVMASADKKLPTNRGSDAQN